MAAWLARCTSLMCVGGSGGSTSNTSNIYFRGIAHSITHPTLSLAQPTDCKLSSTCILPQYTATYGTSSLGTNAESQARHDPDPDPGSDLRILPRNSHSWLSVTHHCGDTDQSSSVRRSDAENPSLALGFWHSSPWVRLWLWQCTGYCTGYLRWMLALDTYTVYTAQPQLQPRPPSSNLRSGSDAATLKR